MRQVWEPEDLLASWTLLEADWELVANKSGATRLGFALILKFFELEARFPRDRGELPAAAVAFAADQVGVPSVELAGYDWAGRSIKYHRAQVRDALGFRESTVSDERRWAGWLQGEVCPVELSADRVHDALLRRCRSERIEPPGSSRIDRVIGTARAATTQFTARTAARLSVGMVDRLEALVTEAPGDGVIGGGASFLAELKADAGRVGLKTLLTEIDKLERVRAIGLPADLFAHTSERQVSAWRARAATLYPLRPARRAAGGAPDIARRAVLGAHGRDH